METTALPLAPAAPELDPAATAFVLLCAALVLLMTPALAIFYGGMTRAKSVLNMMMMSFGAMGVAGVVYVLWGYSMSFGGSDIGGVLQTNNIHLSTCVPGEIAATLAALRAHPVMGRAKAEVERRAGGLRIGECEPFGMRLRPGLEMHRDVVPQRGGLAHPDHAPRGKDRRTRRQVFAPAADVEAGIRAALEAAGVPTGAIQNVAEVMADPQIRARNMVVTIEKGPGGRPLPCSGNPIKMSDLPDPSVLPAAPKLDGDRQAVLDWLEEAEAAVAAPVPRRTTGPGPRPRPAPPTRSR